MIRVLVNFFILFLLSIGAIVDHVHRHEYRNQCRKGLANATSYDVLVGAASVTDEMRAYTRDLIGMDPAECGWEGLAIRPLFNRNETNVDPDDPTRWVLSRATHTAHADPSGRGRCTVQH